MTRGPIAAALLATVAAPLLFPFVELVTRPEAWSAWNEVGRVSSLLANTLALAALTLILALPTGVFVALLVERGAFPGRRWVARCVVVGMFVPLPLITSGWQGLFGTVGPRPWEQGIVAAAFVHAIAAFPWVCFLVGRGLRGVERELEEDALLLMPGVRVAWAVSLRRAKPAVFAAAAWVVVQTATEIVVTDMMLVRTFAEEAYTQLVASTFGAARSLALTMPVVVGGCILTWLVLRSMPAERLASGRRPVALFRVSVAVALPVGLMVFALVALPLVGLVAKTGDAPSQMFANFRLATSGRAWLVFESVLWACIASLVALTLALVAAIASLESRMFRRAIVALAVLAWVTPGPVLGVGIKSLIDALMDIEDAILPSAWPHVIAMALYTHANPLPVVWVHVVRVFPFALALVGPAVWSVPVELRERAKLDGLRPWATFRAVVWPSARAACRPGVLALALLVLGEVSASKMVQIPGHATFAQEVFAQMHYGVPPAVAALGLLQLAVTFLIAWPLLRSTGEMP